MREFFMVTILIFTAIFALCVFLLAPAILLAAGKMCKVEKINFRKASLASLLILTSTIIFTIVDYLLASHGIVDNFFAHIVLTLIALLLAMLIIKKELYRILQKVRLFVKVHTWEVRQFIILI